MNIVIDVGFRSMKSWKDSEKRVEHVFDRMQLRGIGSQQIKEAVQKGAKQIKQDGSIVAEYRWFRVAYRELQLENTRKIYPITVMEV